MQYNKNNIPKALLLIGMLTVLGGCATTKGSDPKDPWQGWNRGAQTFNDNLDDYVMKPVAKGYDWLLPGFAHHAVTNFFSNLDDIAVAANDALQGKFSQSGEDSARLLVNTTLGLGGLIDVGSRLDLPKHLEDFDQTLGVWGVDTGPYLVLPFLGPSSARGVTGILADAALNPISYTGIYFGNDSTMAWIVSGGLGGLKAIDTRANNLAAGNVVSEAALDRYEFFKNAYLARRNYLVHDGNVPDEDVLKFNEDKGKNLGPISPY
ncbi:VacJ family lipoprotein [Methylomonas paludis]|uniref:VacJ family lipoprotein n=1 Tax=Methylomonas paludis TaxID=1173101 RepID=A0A975MKD3_9GAMM|nr:VacJ family lipoprotein [Methylomonas paludis]QWF69508.1 VacJ family lipoprotein [Methylomonas paludis]